MTARLEERLVSKIDFTQGECWQWLDALSHGYGYFFAGRRRRAHRYVYELLIGPIPEGHQLDHLCRNRACVNPAHLEPVTNRENAVRGVGWAGQHARKTHCANGHEFTPENTYQRPSGGRACRTCRRLWDRARKEAAHDERG